MGGGHKPPAPKSSRDLLGTTGRTPSSHPGETSPCMQLLPPPLPVRHTRPSSAAQLRIPQQPHLASRNFLRRLGRSWLRRRRNQRSTWRPESPLCRDNSSTSTWVSRRSHHRALQNSAAIPHPPTLPHNNLSQHHHLPTHHSWHCYPLLSSLPPPLSSLLHQNSAKPREGLQFIPVWDACRWSGRSAPRWDWELPAAEFSP